jgi:hypothetical protein
MKKETKPKSLKEGIFAAAFDVARRFSAFDDYGSQEKAIKALQRRCKGSSAEQCRDAFTRSLNLLAEAEVFVKKNRNTLWKRWDALPKQNYPRDMDTSDLTKLLADRCPGIPLPVCQEALLWVFAWRHIK